VTPAEELRAAATKLRETAAKATPGPWHIREGNEVSSNVIARSEHMVIDGGGWTDGSKAVVYGAALNTDAAWIALASPALAEPLAALLELQAKVFAMLTDSVAPDFAEAYSLPALTLARLINGGAS